ncbi:MAG: hypothetical protein A3H94_02280 [Acidobacteria bacterium RIFCSPLOWO2_02_FULL_60_20]|nr:MAG: hypothetical protein A3H94_02280 [Acidobacteria bacterium RIFCSPLOWO2_02_FULL_60_20]
MDFNRNLKAFLKGLPIKEMTGQQKFLAVAALVCTGRKGVEIATKDIQNQWRKSLLQSKYNPSFYDRAQREDWVDPVTGKKGMFVVTQGGIDNLAALSTPAGELESGELRQSGSLLVFNRKATHTFDKFLRRIFAEAKNQVSIADSWVDDTIFDNVLDVIPKTNPVRLIYAQARGSYEQRARRFSTEFQKFSTRRYKPLHDRFVIVDDFGYVLGPSIKDAASDSPALVVQLSGKEKRLLQSFFEDLWKQAKQDKAYF